MVDRYNGGDSIREVGLRFGCSYGVTRQVLLEAGVTLRSRGGDSRRNGEKPPPAGPVQVMPPHALVAFRLAAAGLTDNEIAEQTGTSPQAVQRRHRKACKVLGARTLAQAVMLGARYLPGLAEPAGDPLPLGAQDGRVLWHIARGGTTGALAARMGVPPGAARVEVRQLLLRMGACQEAHAVALAIRCRMLPAEVPTPGDDDRPGGAS